MSEYKYITTYTFPNGDTWKRKTYSYPNIIDYTCPKCGLYPMNYSQIDMGEWDGYKTICGCELCGARYDEGDPQLKRPKGSNLERYVMGVLKPCTDVSEALIGEENLSSVAKGIKNSKNQKVRITFDEQDMEVPVITPQPRSIRYTPEFLEKAAKAMRDTPLKRQNIHVHEDDMESTCPACGYMLYEEGNMIFNYCPTCGQALNNNDFSEEE